MTAAAAASASVLTGLVVFFMGEPFMKLPRGGRPGSGVFDPAGQDGGGKLVGQGVAGDVLWADGVWQV